MTGFNVSVDPTTQSIRSANVPLDERQIAFLTKLVRQEQDRHERESAVWLACDRMAFHLNDRNASWWMRAFDPPSPLIAPAPPAPEAITLPAVPHRPNIDRCYACGGDGSWHQMIAPSPDTLAIRIHRTTMCPVCQGGGWVNRALDAALARGAAADAERSDA